MIVTSSNEENALRRRLFDLLVPGSADQSGIETTGK